MSDAANRALYRELRERGRRWTEENPDHCPECFCRPGKGDSEEGTDHEKFCSHKES
jgi:hypothetical protein